MTLSYRWFYIRLAYNTLGLKYDTVIFMSVIENELEKRRVRVIAEAKENGAVCEILPDGTIKCMALGKEPRVMVETLDARPQIRQTELHLPVRKFNKAEGTTDPTSYCEDLSEINEGNSDPTLIARNMEVYSKKPFSKPVIAHGSGGHRGWMVRAHNGIAHADEGKVIQQ
jgi:hypothetical protein